jgi:hypothetical protein
MGEMGEMREMREMREMGELTQHLVRAGFVQTLPSIANRKFLNPPLQTGFCTKVTINRDKRVPKPAPTKSVVLSEVKGHSIPN